MCVCVLQQSLSYQLEPATELELCCNFKPIGRNLSDGLRTKQQLLRECNNQQQLRMLTVCAIMTPPPPSRTTGQFTHGQFARKPGDPRGPRTSRNPSINAPCMEVTTAPSMSIISINAGVPVCAPRAASSVCTAHVNLDSDIIGESRHKAGGHTQCNNTRSVTVAGMLHSVVPDDCKTDHTFSAYTAQSRLNITQIRTRRV